VAIVSPGNVDDMTQAVKIYQKLNIPYIADPGQQIPVLKANQLKLIITGSKVLIVNDYEASLIMKNVKNTKILASLRKR